MHRLLRPGASGPLVVLVLGLALLLPEVSHSLAHHHAMEAEQHHHVAAQDHSADGWATLGEPDTDADHPHPDLRATPAAKPLFALEFAPPAVVRQASILGVVRHLQASVIDDPAPPGQLHGPPPPARAPPLI